MITYWPNKQSRHLNLAVAKIFIQTYKKFSGPLNNKTQNYIPTDILNHHAKKQLFIEILIQLEILILDITEINLDIISIQQLTNKIIYDIINKTIYNFIHKLDHKTIQPFSKYSHLKHYNQLFFNEHQSLIYNLIIYLVFGSNSIDQNKFTFHYFKTPFNYVQLLLENTIVQISNIITFNLLENHQSIKTSYEFFILNYICQVNYKSIRSISNFKNNLANYHWINKYIHYPQNIYCSNYQLSIFSTQGIICKNIYFNRTSNYIKLSKFQLLSILYLEIQDFIKPKINKTIIFLGKIIIYILSELISKSIQICSRTIIQKINTKH